ncbi:hypothetical protein ACVBGC_34830, partial [Burkholderia stagnalis]
MGKRDGDVLLLEERFHLPEARPGEGGPMTYRPTQVVREDAADAYSLPVAQRMHTFGERARWE